MTPAERTKRESEGYRYYHGVEFPPQRLSNGHPVPIPEWKAEGLLYLDEDGDFCKSSKHLGKAEHFKRFVNHIWGDPLDEGFFEWNPNACKMLECAVNHNFLAIAGCASCVSGDTKLLDPTTGDSQTIQSLCESGTRPTVQTLNGPVLADVPYLKGEAELFEFKLSNGRSFKCTAEHRLLTPSGWKFAKDVFEGHAVFGYQQESSPSHPQSTSDICLEARRQDASRCSRFSYPLMVSLAVVESIKSVGIQNFYDLNVPVEHHYFAEGAIHHNSGKTLFIALWAVAHFILRCATTKVLVTSMTIQTAEGKVWGNVKKFWRRACRRLEVKDQKGNIIMEGERFLGGKLLDSMHIIKRRSPDGTLHSTEGIELIPAEAGEFKKSASKMQGYKAGNVHLLADELATLAPNILETARENLFSNDNFVLIGAFNPDSHYDPGGVLSEPVDGWDSIDEHSQEWPTRFGGWCVRFDGTLSPNVIGPLNVVNGIEKPWRGLMTLEKLNGFKELHPEKSAGFWKMVRGYWSPTGSMDCIYSESEFEANGCLRPVRAWASPPKMVAGFDPAWTTGGDRAVGVFGRVGLAVLPESGGITRLVWEHVETCVFDEEVDKKGIDKPTQIASQFGEKCRKHGVLTEDIALDITGGHAFSSVLALQVGKGFMALNFGGAASDLPAPAPDNSKRTCKEAYKNLMSELWVSCKSLVRQGQIKNLNPSAIVELCARTYDENNGKYQVEPKEKMKARIKRSPDMADATLLSVYVARKRHKLSGSEKFPKAMKRSQLTENAHLTGGNPNHPLAHINDWAKPEKKVLNEPDKWEQACAGSGGWGDCN